MTDNLSQKEMMLRLMDKMDKVEREQTEHHVYARAKLESIEEQALKTNGRVSKNEKNITAVASDIKQARTVFATLSVILTVAWTGITFFIK